MAVSTNTTVKIIGGFYRGATGKVVKIHSDFNLAIVAIDNTETIVKVSLSSLEAIEPQDQNVSAEFLEGAKRITMGEFFEAVEKVVDPDRIFSDKSINPVAALTEGLAAITFAHTLSEILFSDKDVAIVTEDDLVGALWEACNPVKTSDKIRKSHSAYDCILVSLTAVSRLEEIVPALFGGAND